MDSFVYARKSIGTGSYLVHVYRNLDEEPEALAGTVERLGNGQKRVFHSAGELLRLLGIGDELPGGEA